MNDDILVDTSILGRLANSADRDFATAKSAVETLHRQGHTLRVNSQNLIEFRNFATRPVWANGLGLDSATASKLSDTFEASFPLLEDNPAIFPAWRSLVEAASVTGKQVHDARLVAVCSVHSVSRILTFNTAHFVRFIPFQGGLVVIDPATV